MTLEKLLWRKKVWKLLGRHESQPGLLRVYHGECTTRLVVDSLLVCPQGQCESSHSSYLLVEKQARCGGAAWWVISEDSTSNQAEKCLISISRLNTKICDTRLKKSPANHH
jgi:hypothetical protein